MKGFLVCDRQSKRDTTRSLLGGICILDRPWDESDGKDFSFSMDSAKAFCLKRGSRLALTPTPPRMPELCYAIGLFQLAGRTSFFIIHTLNRPCGRALPMTQFSSTVSRNESGSGQDGKVNSTPKTVVDIQHKHRLKRGVYGNRMIVNVAGSF